MQITLTPVSVSSAIFAGFDDYKELKQGEYIANPDKMRMKFAVRCSAGGETMYSAAECFSNKWLISMKIDKSIFDDFLRRGIKEGTKGTLIYLCKSLAQDKKSIDYFQYLDFQPEIINNAPPKMPAAAAAN